MDINVRFVVALDEATIVRLAQCAESQTARVMARIDETEKANVMNFDRLQQTVGALVAKSQETEGTLRALAQAVVDLKAALPADQQSVIDALADQAQAALDGLTAAEDSADDQVPQP